MCLEEIEAKERCLSVCLTVTAILRNIISRGSIFDGANHTGQHTGRTTRIEPRGFYGISVLLQVQQLLTVRRLRLKCDGTRAETRFRLSAKRTSPFKSARASV